MVPRFVVSDKPWHTRVEYFAPRYAPSVVDPSSSGYQPGAYRDTFTFSGGGPNWDKRHRYPVAIDYHKEFKTPAIGEHVVLSSDLSNVPMMEWKKIGAFPLSSRYTTDDVVYDTDANLYNKCLSKFYDKIKEAETNLALSLFEAKETKRSLPLGKSLTGLALAARQAKKNFLRNPSKSLAKIWLGMKYAYVPLCQDIYNWLDYTQKAFAEGVPIKARKTSYVRKDEIYNPTPDFTWANARDRYQITKRMEIGGTLFIDDNAAYNRSRMTSLNPQSILWELTPLSFVADWLVDVSSYLQNYEAALYSGLQWKHGYWTKVVRVESLLEVYGEQEWTDWYSWVKYKESISTSTYHLRAYKSRTVLVGNPLPMPPRLKVNLGAQRILSTAALIRTILLGKVR